MAVVALVLSGLRASAAEPPAGGEPPNRVVLALKWHPQFQFAGYYAAQARGYYAEEGLEVEFTTPTNGVYPVETVLSGKAHYGVTSADLVKARVAGQPVVALAVLFQHSPIILMSRKDRELAYLADYVGKTVMGSPDDLPEIKAMFLKEGIDPGRIRFVPHTWTVDALVNGEVDATVDYIANEPYQLRARGVEPRIIRPIDYGIDFYADTLFTTEEEIRRHPERAAAFRRASLRGWEYALEHVEEMIDRIVVLPGVAERGKTREHLRYEAAQITHESGALGADRPDLRGVRGDSRPLFAGGLSLPPGRPFVALRAVAAHGRRRRRCGPRAAAAGRLVEPPVAPRGPEEDEGPPGKRGQVEKLRGGCSLRHRHRGRAGPVRRCQSRRLRDAGRCP